MTYDAVVVGGGIVGVSIAYHLGCAGARTLLLDRADVGRATDAGAGIISPETNSRDPDSWVILALEAAAYYSTLIQRLQDEQAGDTGYAQCGLLTVAVSPDEHAPFARAQHMIFSRQQRRGQPATADLHEVSASAAQELFPPLASVHGAIHFRHAARVDGRLLAQALRQAAVRRGVEIQPLSVDQLVIEHGAVTGVVAASQTYTAGHVAIAGGAWSRAFGTQLGVDIPVEPQRGQIIHLGLLNTDTRTWPIISAFRGHYMVPWPDQRVVVGATRETGSGFAPSTTAAGVQEVLSEALRVAPGLAQATIRDIRVGLRPVTTDTLPVLGPVPGIRNVWLATGHGPTGLTLGPYSGKVIADLMLGQASSVDLTAFTVSRFQ